MTNNSVFTESCKYMHADEMNEIFKLKIFSMLCNLLKITQNER